MMEKSLPQPSSPQAKGRLFTPYVIVWASLAALSVVYLGLLFAQPATVAGVLGAAPPPADAAAAARQMTETANAVRDLRDAVDQFRSELFEMRAQISSQSEQARDLSARMAALEAGPAVAAAPAAKDAKAQKSAKAKGAEPAEKTAMAAPDGKAAAVDMPKKKSKSLETGSVEQKAAPAITFGPPTVTTNIPVPAGETPSAQSQYAVQIATGPSVDSLRLSWTLLNERHGETLRPLEPRYKTDASSGEPSFDLVVGPVADADTARRLCQELALKGTPCAVSQFTGSAL
jgi:TolA-binding protein